jgi:hypothetical protein
MTFDTLEEARTAAQAKADASARDVVIQKDWHDGVKDWNGPGTFSIRFCRGEKGTATSGDYVTGEVVTPNFDNVDWSKV